MVSVLLQLQTNSVFLIVCDGVSFLCFSWKEMWLQDYWQSLDQGEALTAMIHRNESHQGRFWDYMHEIFLKRTRQHWPIFVRAWFENCIESWGCEFLPHFKCLPWKKQNQKTSHRDNFFWCMKWVSFCYTWISAVEMLVTALIWVSALWCEATPDLQVSTCGAKEEFILLLHLLYLYYVLHDFRHLFKCPKLFQGFFKSSEY